MNRCWVLVLSFGITACGGEAGAAGGALVRDSVGVQIVQNGADTPPLGWTLEEAPAVSIGGGGPGHELHHVTAAARLAGGRVLVANAGTGEIRIFSPDGEFLHSFGGRGSGPGEFEMLSWAGPYRGDSIAAWDGASARLTVFDSAGIYGRSATAQDLAGVFPSLVGFFADGSLVVTSGLEVRDATAMEGRAWRGTATYLRLSTAGVVLDTLGRFPGDEQYTVPRRVAGTLAVESLPFGRRTVAAVGKDGLYVGTGEGYEVRLYSPEGRLTRIVRRAYRPARVTPADITAYRENLVTSGGAGADDLRVLDQAPYPRVHPAYVALQVDDEGYLWLREPHSAATEHGDARWSVFAPDGTLLGMVAMPRRFRVLHIGRDHLVASVRDDDQVQQIRVHQLHR